VILVTGSTGFIGPKVVHALRAEQHVVRCLVRKPNKAGTLKAWGCELVQGDVAAAGGLQAAAEGCEAVVHLVSIIAGSPSDFRRFMTEGTQNVVAEARAAGVRRFVLMSALGVSEQTRTLVPYYASKWDMEQAVRASGIEHVIFRPSFVFGRDGGALPLFVRQVRWSPVTPVIGSGERRLQPIWVEDVAAYFAAAIDLPEAANRTFDLCGPERVTWNELYQRIALTLGKRRRRMHLPVSVARVGATVAERLPNAPLTRDQLTMLEAGDNVGDTTPARQVFGIEPIGLDEQLRRAV
jgi:NADH dehydrogenase